MDCFRIEDNKVDCPLEHRVVKVYTYIFIYGGKADVHCNGCDFTNGSKQCGECLEFHKEKYESILNKEAAEEQDM